MTVGQRVKQTLASLKSCQADFESYALETQNNQAKQFFEQAAQDTNKLVQGLDKRVKEMERAEPQYRGF